MGKRCPEGCNGKKRYKSENHAAAIARRLQKKDGDKMMCYPCSYGGWHVGHVFPSEAKRRRALKSQNTSTTGIFISGQPVPSNRVEGKRKNGHNRKYDRKPRRYYPDDVFFRIPDRDFGDSDD